MIVVAHQHVGVNAPAGLLASLRQRLDEVLPVNVIEEDLLPTITPAHDMIHGPRILETELARHASVIKREKLLS